MIFDLDWFTYGASLPLIGFVIGSIGAYLIKAQQKMVEQIGKRGNS